MMETECRACHKPIDHKIEHVMYYANGKPVHLRMCLKCMKERYMRIFKDAIEKNAK